ncbi:hypothetical protein HS088_TW17G00189 [Tripterygium wilfordii]|uniref:RING-type domain-containing protein n=1 Tax=Tripterygium wilfordii TaxID=458696 RepID=A0A7J7CEU5_TRIWF|nr:E3 ubiquitin-protein ligase RFI2-like [Tripterygium wilfordii]KAF5732659.1 hypothetical protein HS088_TW17G00189 [Tripterygium wilfordii]
MADSNETDRGLSLDRLVDDHRDVDRELPSSCISCSICLDSVEDNGVRSTAKLQCGHGFHLDCIGSAFNMKGAMQCPNCRKVERGQWLYATGPVQSLPELSMDNLIAGEDVYDLSYSEMPFRVHWCPLGDLAQLGSSFEEVETPSTMFQNVQGHPPIFADQAAISSVAHSYVTYVAPIPPTSSGPIDTVADSYSSRPWNGASRRSEIFNLLASPALTSQYHGWSSYSTPLPLSGGHSTDADRNPVPPLTLRSSTGGVETVTMPRALTQPFVFHHGSGPRGGSSLATPTIPCHSVGSVQNSESNHVFHPFPYQQQSNHPQGMPSLQGHGHGIRRFDVPRSTTMAVPAPPHHDHNGGFYMVPPSLSAHNPHEAGFLLSNHLSRFPNPSIDRDGGSGPFHHIPGHFSRNRTGSGWPRR